MNSLQAYFLRWITPVLTSEAYGTFSFLNGFANASLAGDARVFKNSGEVLVTQLLAQLEHQSDLLRLATLPKAALVLEGFSCRSTMIPSAFGMRSGMRQTLEGSFLAVSKPNFARKYAFESSRRELHNALLCIALKLNILHIFF